MVNGWPGGMTMAINTPRAAAIRTTLSLTPPLGAQSGGASAFAQARRAAPAPAAQDRNMAADIVTAPFREETPQGIPIAITAVNAATLWSRSGAKRTDVANEAPRLACSPTRRTSAPERPRRSAARGRSTRGMTQAAVFPPTMFMIRDGSGPISICSMWSGSRACAAGTKRCRRAQVVRRSGLRFRVHMMSADGGGQ